VSFAGGIEARMRGRPHVGVVMHFEGMDVPALAARLRGLLDAGGLHHEDAVEETNGAPVFNAVAPIAAGDGLELWLSASEKQGVGCKLEMRVYHSIEDSARADEYLACFSDRVNT
jgi:hypothetical protein